MKQQCGKCTQQAHSFWTIKKNQNKIKTRSNLCIQMKFRQKKTVLKMLRTLVICNSQIRIPSTIMWQHSQFVKTIRYLSIPNKNWTDNNILSTCSNNETKLDKNKPLEYFFRSKGIWLEYKKTLNLWSYLHTKNGLT